MNDIDELDPLGDYPFPLEPTMDKHEKLAREVMYKCPQITGRNGKPVYLYSREKIAAALRAIEQETIERCAKWHDEQCVKWKKEAAGYADGTDTSAFCWRASNIHLASAGALRALKEQSNG